MRGYRIVPRYASEQIYAASQPPRKMPKSSSFLLRQKKEELILHRRKPTLLPQRQPILHEQEGNRQHQDSDSPEDTHRRPDTKVVEHRPRHKRKPTTQQTPQEGVRGRRAGGVELVRVDEEIDALLEDHVEAHADERGGDDGTDPVDGRISRPAEEEQSDGEGEGADNHGRESRLGDLPATGGLGDARVARLVGEVDGDAQQHADEEGDEGEGGVEEGPVALFVEDDGEDLERRIEEGEDEGGVEADHRHHRFGGQHDEGAGEVFGHDGFEVEFDVFVWVVVPWVTGLFAQAARFVLEEEGAVHLGQAEEGEGECGKDKDRGEVSDDGQSYDPCLFFADDLVTYSVHRQPRCGLTVSALATTGPRVGPPT